MASCYPVLTGEIAKRGIKKKAIADQIGVSARAFYNKLDGTSSFTWDEVCMIAKTFFPDMNVHTLFAHNDFERQKEPNP